MCVRTVLPPPTGLCSFSNFTQGLRPGLDSVAASRLDSVAASRLDSGGFVPPGQSEIEFSHRLSRLEKPSRKTSLRVPLCPSWFLLFLTSDQFLPARCRCCQSPPPHLQSGVPRTSSGGLADLPGTLRAYARDTASRFHR